MDVVYKHSGVTLPISRELLDDMGFQVRPLIVRELADHILLGQSRRHSNPMPHYVLFPRTQRIIDMATRLHAKTTDAIYAFKHGIPEPYED